MNEDLYRGFRAGDPVLFGAYRDRLVSRLRNHLKRKLPLSFPDWEIDELCDDAFVTLVFRSSDIPDDRRALAYAKSVVRSLLAKRRGRRTCGGTREEPAEVSLSAFPPDFAPNDPWAGVAVEAIDANDALEAFAKLLSPAARLALDSALTGRPNAQEVAARLGVGQRTAERLIAATRERARAWFARQLGRSPGIDGRKDEKDGGLGTEPGL